MSAARWGCYYPADLRRDRRPRRAGGDVAGTMAGTAAVTCFHRRPGADPIG
jgi:hypothetical protein